MWLKLDGTIQFEQALLSIDGWSRQCDERSAVGLDGVLSVDMGRRTRRIVQEATIRSVSKNTMQDSIEVLNNTIDGLEHILQLQDGRSFEHLRVDDIAFGQVQISGAGVTCSVKITFTQLN